MNRENLLFAIIGLLLGFIVGFMFASSMSQKVAQSQTASASQNLPADHPPIGAHDGTDPAAMREQVTAKIQKARSEPTNFDAQVEAANLYYQIERYDQPIEFLFKDNQIKPHDHDTRAALGVVNPAAGHYDQAEKWYSAAVKIRPDDERVVAGV